MKQPIILNNFNLGGIADSEYHGIAGSVADMVAIDIHNEPGIISVNQTLKSVHTTESLVGAIVPCSDGNVYFFEENGKIWKKEGDDFVIFSEIGEKIYDAKEFDDYVYFTTQNHIGRWKIGTTNVEKTFGEMTNKDEHYHPMFVLNLILYVGDGNLLAQVEDNIWVPDALDLPKGLKIKCLGGAVTDILIGTTVHNNHTKTQIFRWNTWSESWTVADEIPETGINAILSMDNAILVQAGEKGNIYAYNGQNLERHKRIPGKWRNGSAEVLLNATTNKNGIPLFGLSKKSGDAVKTMVYSYGNYASNYPVVLTKEYAVEGDKIGAMSVIDGVVYVTTENGIYAEDSEQKAEKGVIVSRVIDISREEKKNGNVTVCWKNKPKGTDIKVYVRENYGEWRELELIHDEKRHISYTKTNTELGNYFQIKMEIITKNNMSPEVTAIIIKA